MNERHGFSYFITIWIGDFVSTIGSGLTAFALGVYAFQLTGRASSTAMVVLLSFLPAFILRPVGGVLADRMDRTLLMIVGNLGSALGIGLIIFLMSIKARDLIMAYPGMVLSSVFFALQNPAYKACISDFLPAELYAKASGLVQLSNASQFLIAPFLGGILISLMNINYVLFIDLITFIFSAVAIIIVRFTLSKNSKSSREQKKIKESHFFKEIMEGFNIIIGNRGLFILTLLISLLLFYVGLIQTLLGPMVLAFANARTLGIVQSVCALGMLLSSLLISMIKRKIKNVVLLTYSLSLMGVFFSFIGIKANIWAVIVPGFLFFTTVPFANMSIDVLIRKNIGNHEQGRVWSLITVITYLGAVVAYGISGFLADKVFNPFFLRGKHLLSALSYVFGMGPGRGIALMFFISGIFVLLLSLSIYKSKSIWRLDADSNLDTYHDLKEKIIEVG